MHSRADSWPYRRMDAQPHGRADAEMRGCRLAQPHGCTAAWTYRRQDARPYICAARMIGSADSRTHGRMAARPQGRMDARMHGGTDARRGVLRPYSCLRRSACWTGLGGRHKRCQSLSSTGLRSGPAPVLARRGLQEGGSPPR
eukprot:9063555-Alexandrium_andersonii.AAC.1